jgi:hypothetical protein
MVRLRGGSRLLAGKKKKREEKVPGGAGEEGEGEI